MAASPCLRAIEAVKEVKAKGDEKIGVEIIVRALEAPIRQIASNSGTDGSVVADEVRQKAGNIGYDANTGEYVDMFKKGIVDPTKVVKNALLERRVDRRPDAHDAGSGHPHRRNRRRRQAQGRGKHPLDLYLMA